MIERLNPRRGTERLRVTEEDEYFPPPRQLRELQSAFGIAATAMLGGECADAVLDDRRPGPNAGVVSGSTAVAAAIDTGTELFGALDTHALAVRGAGRLRCLLERAWRWPP